MNLQPTQKTANEIAIENGWTCRSLYGPERIVHHSELRRNGQKVIVFANQNWSVEIYKCGQCGLHMEIVRGPATPKDPPKDHAERCAGTGCNHLKHEHYYTVEGSDENRAWVRTRCQHEEGGEDACRCRRYTAPKRPDKISLPSTEIVDVQRVG